MYGCNGISQVHPDQHAMDFLQSNPSIAYFGNYGGVNRSLSAQTNLNNGTCGNAPNVFDNLNSHLGPLTQFMWGTNHPTDPNTLMGGSQDNGTMAIAPSLAAPGDAGWWSVNADDGGYNWIDPVTPTNWYSAYTGVSIQQCTSGINCNTNNFLPIVEEDLSSGSTHQVDGDESNFYTPYILDPAKPSQIIVGTCRVWRGGNSAASWPNDSTANALSHKLGTTSDAVCQNPEDPIQSLAAGGPSTSNGSKVIYAGTSAGHLYMTKDAATGISSWTEVTGKIDPDGFPLSAIAIDPQDADGMTAYAVVQGFTYSGYGHIWQTTDGGTTWNDLTSTFPNVPVNDIVVDPDTHNLFVATDVGVFTSVSGAQWIEVGSRAAPGAASGYLPNVAVLHLAIFEKGTDKRLRAWTHGRGVWETPLVNPDLSISSESMFFTSFVGVASPTQSLSLKNLGTSAITLGTPSLADTPTQFAIAGSTCGTSLNPGASCAIAIDFDPASVSDFTDYLSLPTSSQSYGAVNVALTGNVLTSSTDFAIDTTSNPTTATVAAGGTATYSFNLNGLPNGTSVFNPVITFACSGLPSKSACAFSPISVSAPGPVAMAIKTTGATTASADSPSFGARFGIGLFAVFAWPGLSLLLPLMGQGSRRKRLSMYSASFILFACMLGTMACGGGGSSSSHTTIPGTPAGTYSVGVTGTYGSITHTQVVTLTVQ
jgi:hypothetical protein